MKDEKGRARVEPVSAQGDLFKKPMSVSELATAGMRDAPAASSAIVDQQETLTASSRTRGANRSRRMGV